MTDRTDNADPARPPAAPARAGLPSRPSRRQVLALLGAGGAAAAGGFGLIRSRSGGSVLDSQLSEPIGSRPRTGEAAEPEATTETTTGPGPAVADLSARLLVVLELRGGNDGLATVVPRDDPTLAALRPSLLVGAEETDPLVDFADGTGLVAGLSPLRDRGLAVLQGIGTPEPNGSHFVMEDRWWQGDSTGRAGMRTGFLGRLCDELDEGSPMTGVSLGSGATPALIAARATTVALPDPWAGWFLTEDDPWFQNLRSGLTDLGLADRAESPLMSAARDGLVDALTFAELLGAVEEGTGGDYPETDLAWRLSIGADLLDSGTGIRVLHVPFEGFDTHDGQAYTHPELMSELGGAVAAFQDDLARRGLADRTLIATTSEFGRRPEENGGGTDHGTAGPALLAGPVVAGLHGDAPRLDRLDDDGNLVPTMMFDDYYATIAESWFGISPDLVLPSGGDPVPGLIS